LSLGAGLSSIAPNSDLTIPQREALGYISGFAGEQGRRMHEMDVAEEGRDQIVINIEREKDSQYDDSQKDNSNYSASQYDGSNPTPIKPLSEYDFERLKREFYGN